jgi:predicted RNase H-like nuclease (RuvC/YqgF family)
MSNENLTELADAKIEIMRLRRAIQLFGNGNDFDWNVLKRIDELEDEVTFLKSELASERRSRERLVKKLNGAQKPQDQPNE